MLSPSTPIKDRWELYVDGAARNNPGPAGAGFYLLKNGKPVLKQGMFLGKKTNNQAEYLALLLGIYYAQQHMGQEDRLIIKADSQLMVRQVQGVYKIKNSALAQLHAAIRSMLDALNFTIEHVPREENRVADTLANAGIDKKIPVPPELLLVWPVYEDMV
jgi:ribonuclease HI